MNTLLAAINVKGDLSVMGFWIGLGLFMGGYSR